MSVVFFKGVNDCYLQVSSSSSNRSARLPWRPPEARLPEASQLRSLRPGVLLISKDYREDRRRVAILALGNSRASERAISTPSLSQGCAIRLYLGRRREDVIRVSALRISSSAAEGMSLDALLHFGRAMVDPDLDTELPHLKGGDFFPPRLYSLFNGWSPVMTMWKLTDPSATTDDAGSALD